MRTLCYICLLVFVQSLYAINDDLPSDASSQALGGVSVVLDHPSAVMNNPAITAYFDSPLIISSFSSSFSIDRMGAAVALPLRQGVVGMNVQRSGLLDYAEMKYGLYYARAFGSTFSAALQIDGLSVVPQSTASSQWAISGEVALWYQPTADFSVGIHIYNVLGSQYEMFYYDEQIPVNLKFGFAYTVFDNFTLVSEIENSSVYGTSIRGGVEYAITDGVYFRTGGATNPVLASLGLGFELNNWRVDAAAQVVRTIGKTGAVSLAYVF